MEAIRACPPNLRDFAALHKSQNRHRDRIGPDVLNSCNGRSRGTSLVVIAVRLYIAPQHNEPMIKAFRKLLRPAADRSPARVPTGERVYAIGDIHGRLDLFAVLAEAIEADDAARGPADTTVILLGDLIDRGPDSAAVIEGARAWQSHRRVRILAGNHEEMFLDSLRRLSSFRHFLKFGGYETILSYPVDAAAFRAAEMAEAQEMMRRAVPAEDIAFIRDFEDAIVVGDYLFVHAGLQPGVPLPQQKVHELRWIREPFLSHGGNLGHVVVHGHTITDDVTFRPNRIGIDTGAYMSGKLTALCLEGADRWLIETTERDGQVTISTRTT